MKNPNLPHVRQQIWTVIHFPFHLALVLFMQGFTQFVIWTKIIDTLKNLTLDSVFNDINDIAKSTTQNIIDNLTKMVTDFFKLYPPKYASTWTTVENAITNISDIADDFWPQFAKYATTLEDKDSPDEQEFNSFAESFYSISYAMENSLLETFGIDLVTEVSEDKANSNITENALEAKVNEQTWTRFELIVSLDPLCVLSILSLA